jgi:energy-coupling factor transport system permease protein
MSALLLVALLYAAALRVGFRRLFGSLKRLWQVAIAIALMQSIFAPSGTILIAIGSVNLLTSGGLIKGLLILFRLALFITGGAMFTPYSQRALIQGMVQVRLPYEAAYMISIGLRFIPQMREEFRDSLTALQLRGVVLEELRLRKRLSLYFYLLLPALAASLQNARELAMSMEMRAFRAMRGRTSYYTLALKRSDVIMLCAIVMLAASLTAAMILIPPLNAFGWVY